MVVGSMLGVFHRLGLVLGSSAVRLDTFITGVQPKAGTGLNI